MIKKMMCGLALMGCALSSQAEVQGFDWSYTGFLPSYSSSSNPQPEYGEFDPNLVLKGRFLADDRDKNGVFSVAELTSFTIDGQSFMDCTGERTCFVDNFSFTLGGALTFSAFDTVDYRHDNGVRSITTRGFRTARGFYTYRESGSGADGYSHHITEQTKFAISAVPEPQTWLMLGAGIALLGAVKRRRSRKV
ncbi:PEP-CTERM sorting domain-containing protein [Massilia violaceinigra]|nr:PEP-CTERM sorting domain-containing protein [Massilia violaceinigra]